MADVNSTLIDVFNDIALALQVKLNTNNKFKPINYAVRVLDIGSEANAAASDVKLGKKAYVGDDYIDGTFEGIDLTVPLSIVEQTFEPETGKYYKKVIVPAASAPTDVWDGTGIIVEQILKLATPVIELVEPENSTV